MPSNQATAVKKNIEAAPSPASSRSRRADALNGALLSLVVYVVFAALGLLELLPPLRVFSFSGLIFLAVGALIGARRPTVMPALTIISVLMWMVVAFTPLSLSMVNSLRTQAPAEEIERGADAVMVLSSRVQSSGDLTGAAMARLLRGLELVRQNRAPVLVFSAVAQNQPSYIKEAERLTRSLKIGVKMEEVPGRVVNTHDEALAFAQLARKKKWRRVLLVTSPTHTRRSSLVFRHAGRDIHLQVLPVAAQETDADLGVLTDPGDRVAAFKMAIREIVGLQVYRRRGWI